MKGWLFDTGPLVAYLDPRDPQHARVSEAMDRFTGSPISTTAVMTEAMLLVGHAVEGAKSLAELVTRSRMRVVDLCHPADLREAARLMERHADTPMDFADATLVLLASAIDVVDILTLDRHGFSTYRTDRGKGFRLVLDFE